MLWFCLRLSQVDNRRKELSAVISLHVDVEGIKSWSLACSPSLEEQDCLDSGWQVLVCPTSMPFPGQSLVGVYRANMKLLALN